MLRSPRTPLRAAAFAALVLTCAPGLAINEMFADGETFAWNAATPTAWNLCRTSEGWKFAEGR